MLGAQSSRSDVVASSGLDDRKSSNGYLSKAQSLLAEAVGADQAFFSTCGSSLSIKAAVLAVTRGEGELLVSRDARKTVSSGLVLSGLQPRGIRPRWDDDLKLAHPPAPETVEKMRQRYPEASHDLDILHVLIDVPATRRCEQAGMVLPDPADPELKTISVLREKPRGPL